MDPNDILPSLKESLESDLKILDQYFDSIDQGNFIYDREKKDIYKANRQAAVSWANVREAAISFAEMFDKQKDTNDIPEGG